MCLLFDSDHIHKEESSNQSNHLRLGGFDRKMLWLDSWLAKVSDHLIAGDSFVTAAAEWLPSSPGGQPVVKFTIYLH